MLERLKSKVVLVAVLAQVVSLLVSLGVIDTGAGEALNGVIVAVCEALVVFGVLNNPTDKENF